MLSTVAVERLGIPKVHVTDGPNGARGNSLPGLGGPPSTCIPCGSAIGATWNPESGAGAWVPWSGGKPVTAGAAACWPRRSTCTAHPWPDATSSATPRTRCSRVASPPGTSGGPVRGRLRHRQALRRQRRRVRALLHQLGHRRALTARALPGALRDRRPRGRRPRHHDGLQPAQRALVDPAACVPARHPARRVGFRGPGDDRLVRRHRDDHVTRCRARPRNARTGPGIRIDRGSPPSRTATSTRPTSTPP